MSDSFSGEIKESLGDGYKAKLTEMYFLLHIVETFYVHLKILSVVININLYFI